MQLIKKIRNCTGIEKQKWHFSRSLTSLLFANFSKTLLTTHWRLTGGRLTTDETLQIFGKQDSFLYILNSSTNIYVKRQAHSFSEPQRKHTIRNRYLWQIKEVGYDLLDQFRNYIIIMQSQISSRRETVKDIPESSRLKFSEKFSPSNFCLSYSEYVNSRRLYWWDIAKFSLSIKLFSIRQNSLDPN